MPTFLLTWNPAVWDGEIIDPCDWSCGNNKRIKVGDRLFLIRQGTEPRGMVASGKALSDVFEDDEGVRRVRMGIDILLDAEIEEIYPRSELIVLNDGLAEPMNWGVRTSGTRIPDAVAARLELSWREFLSGRRGTGSYVAEKGFTRQTKEGFGVTTFEAFNPTIDRYDHRSAARLFQLLWPDAVVARAVAENLAASVRVAHAAGEACWGITMFAHRLRLNVGQVETLTLSAEGGRYLFRSPLVFDMPHRFEIRVSDNPIYPAVPVPSGVCFVPQSELATLPEAIRNSHEAYIQAAASFKRSSPFKRSFSPSVLEYIELALGTTLPRPSYAPIGSPGQCVDLLPEELDASLTRIEGARYQITVNAYERDPRARQLCIARHGTTCAICEFSFGAVYGPVAEGFIHVHHLRPLSEIGGEYQVNPIEDLRPVCPNCHAVLHRRVPAFSINEVRAFLGQKLKE